VAWKGNKQRVPGPEVEKKTQKFQKKNSIRGIFIRNNNQKGKHKANEKKTGVKEKPVRARSNARKTARRKGDNLAFKGRKKKIRHKLESTIALRGNGIRASLRIRKTKVPTENKIKLEREKRGGKKGVLKTQGRKGPRL